MTPTCPACGGDLERMEVVRTGETVYRCWIHGLQNVRRRSRLANVAAGVFFAILVIGVALALAATIFFGVAWLLTEGTP